MAIDGLRIIGESINDSVPSTNKMLEAGDLDSIVNLAKVQSEKGATYIDVNIGGRPPSLMAELVTRIQEVTSKPLSIDTPDPEIAEAGLRAYDLSKADGKPPVLNSISPLRLEMFDLYKTKPFHPILMVSERIEGGVSRPNKTAEDTLQAARNMVAAVRNSGHPIGQTDCILDPGIAPIGSDTEGLTRMTLGGIELIHGDPDLAGVHMSVGLSNFTVMLPSKRSDGSPVKGALESAFLTKAMPFGLDTIVGSVNRRYNVLSTDHPAMVCLEEALKHEGYEVIMRVQEFYSS